MTETKLFVSSCNRRELARRRNHSWLGALAVRSTPALIGLTVALIGAAAFFAGRGAL